jgi:hypothetical protein
MYLQALPYVPAAGRCERRREEDRGYLVRRIEPDAAVHCGLLSVSVTYMASVGGGTRTILSVFHAEGSGYAPVRIGGGAIRCDVSSFVRSITRRKCSFECEVN